MKTKIEIFLLLFFLQLITIVAYSQHPVLNINLKEKGVAMSPVHYGIFFEDINHAADGGLYAELISNRSFEDADTLVSWSKVASSGATVAASIETANLLNPAQSKALKLQIATGNSAGLRAGIYNSGFWGIPVVDGRKYKLSFFAKADANFAGNVVVSLGSASSKIYAADTIHSLSTQWQKYTLELTAKGNDANARLTLSFNSNGTVWLDVVSLFPPTFNNRENGLRPELAQLLADMQPRFMRFPGGCFVEGDVLSNRFQWKKTIGKIEDRPGHSNLWGYRTSDGMGYHEFLQLSEDLGAKPLYVVNVGLAHNDYQAYTDLNWYIQDALDAIEYANGAATTTYGAMRVANGHPEPFGLEYVEIGNENYFGNNYSNRYSLFYNAIKAKYSNIQLIGNVAAWGTDSPAWTFSYPVDYVDEHYYRSPQWFIDQYQKYDSYSRTSPKVYVGEYAVTSGCGNGNLIAALGEAVYMAGMEKNSDIVPMNSYAPIFVNNNDRKWNPDMIVYNSSSAYATPSYYVQKLFATNVGTVNVTVHDSLNVGMVPIQGKIGLGTWATTAQYDDVTVTAKNNSVIYTDAFDTSANWTPSSGTWGVLSGVYRQSANSTDCRSVCNAAIADTTYTYSLKARKTGGNEGFLIIFGYKDSDNFYWWNIGGWNNTQNAIEKCTNGSKTTVTSVAGSINSNVWYDIRIEVSPSQVLCYLNNTLVHTLRNTAVRKLYTAASMDENNGKVYLKVVNPSDSAVSSVLRFKGGQLISELDGSVSEMSSTSGLDENSFDMPEKVAPVISPFAINGSECNFTFKANSVAVFQLTPKYTTGIALNPDGNTNPPIRIYPNPCSTFIQVENMGTETRNLRLKITDLRGQEVFQKNIETTDRIDVSKLPSGTYVASLVDGDSIYSEKLIKK